MGLAQKRLKRARHMRHLIASEFRALEQGTLNVADALEHPSGALNRVAIYNVLRRTPGLGEETVKKILTNVNAGEGCWPMTRVGALSKKERHEIIAALPDRVKN